MAKRLTSLAIVIAAAGGLLLAARTPSRAREIHVVARDMSFYVDGAAEANPTLRMRSGESIRLVLRNEDEGMTHDFAIPGIGAATKRLAAGEEASMAFRAPENRGEQPYTCRPHSRIMRGTILVE